MFGAIWRRDVHLPLPSRPQIAGVAALCAVVVLLFPRALLYGEAFYERDLTFNWVTQTEIFVRAIDAGAWPIWDPSVSFGRPLLAIPDVQAAYPPTWLNLLMGPWTYYTLFAAGHLKVAGTGAAALARAFGASRPAAVAAGAFFMSSGPLLSLVNVYHHYASASWIPWTALLAWRTVESRSLRHAVLWAMVLAAQLLAGSADMCVLGHVLTVAIVGPRLRWRRPASAENLRLVGLCALALTLSAALAAVQWLPTFELLRHSMRTEMTEELRTVWSVTPARLLQIALAAPLWDLPLAPHAQLAIEPLSDSFLRSLHLGLPMLALAAAGLTRHTGAPRRALAVAALAALLFALGSATPFYGLSTTIAPVLRVFRYPSKAMPVAALCFALLAGLGIDDWSRAVSRRKWIAAVVLPLALGVALAVAAAAACASGAVSVYLAAPAAETATLLAPLARQLAIGATVGAVALVFALLQRGAFVVAVLGVIGLIIVGQDVNRTAPRAPLDGHPPILDAIPRPTHGARLYVFEYLRTSWRHRRYLHRDEPYPIRVPPGLSLRDAQVLSQRLYPFPPVAGRWGFEASFESDQHGLFPPGLAALSRLASDAEGTPLYTWLLRMGAVHHVVALHTEGLSALETVTTSPTLFPEPARLYRVPDARPRAYVVGGARPGGDVAELQRAAQEMDLAREVLIADLPARIAPDPAFAGTVAALEIRPDRVHVDVEANAPAWLVMVDTFDAGWRARVDGSPVELRRANVAFRAVRVPPGRHAVDLVYRPTGVIVGLTVTGAALIAMAVLWRVSARQT